MQITLTYLSPTKVEINVVADASELTATKDHVLNKLAKDVTVTGFRKGHAPKAMVEKNVDQATLQSQFLDEAVNELYIGAVTEKKLRPVALPEVSVNKFVPFSTLEFKAVLDVIGKVTLPDYKKIKMAKKVETTTDKDVSAVLDDLRRRDSEKKEVTRPAKDGDEVVLDFTGVDAKTKEAIAGAAGTDYPLVLGSGSFIPGFEPEIVGLKADDTKTFDITFPKDYGNTELQSKKVSFSVTVHKVQELVLPKLDDAFAVTVGPFKSLAELKTDVKKQLQAEKDNQAQRTLENDLLASIAEKAKADIPSVLVDEEIDRMEADEKRNIVYRGQTWEEHLTAEGKTEKQHHEDLRESAEIRVKTGLVLGEVAEAEGINVSEPEFKSRVAALKAQYTDKQMQAELEKPEHRRELMSRIVTEKAIASLVGYATKA